MISRVVPAIVCVILMLPVSSRAFDENVGKERIGVRTGGLATFDGLNTAYGSGWDLTLFFTERVTRHFLIDLRLGALYLGALKLEQLDDQIMHQPGIEGSMRVLYITLGPMVGRSLGGPYSMNLAAGAGIYSVSMVFNNSLSPYEFSEQKFGFNGGMGLARRVSTNWSLEATGSVHYFLIEKNTNDIYYSFTGGADPPVILDITVGAVLDLR